MINAKVSEKHIYRIEKMNGGLVVNGQPRHIDIRRIDARRFHIIIDNKSHLAVLLLYDEATGTASIKIGAQVLSVQLEDEKDRLLQKLGMTEARADRLPDVLSPMPGKIVDIAVREGDTIQEGQTLIVLQAMKMENSIKSPGKGTVKKICVQSGMNVEKNQLLIQF
jgi:biotin carboxyl carrier protein